MAPIGAVDSGFNRCDRHVSGGGGPQRRTPPEGRQPRLRGQPWPSTSLRRSKRWSSSSRQENRDSSGGGKPGCAARRNRRAGHRFGATPPTPPAARGGAGGAGRVGVRQERAGLRQFPLLRLRPRSAPPAPQSSRQRRVPAPRLRCAPALTGSEKASPAASSPAQETPRMATQDAAVSISAWRLAPTISSNPKR